MDSIYGQYEDYQAKCGELFLTIKGNIAFHCTLCENRYKNFNDYNEHILETHYEPILKFDLATESMNNEDNSCDPLSEKSYQASVEDFFIDEVEEMVTYVSPEEEDLSEENFTEIVEMPAEISTADPSKPSKEKEAIIPKLRSINVKPTITDRKYKCPHCGFSGADKSNMRGHIKRHSMNKPHKCTECQKAFHTRTELNTHLRSHTGECPFLCTLCGRGFKTSSSLCSHKKRHDNIRDKECEFCKMRFYDLDALRGHMVVHSEKRNYKCEECDASFKLPLALKNHKKLHENKRAYQCKLCDARFNQNAGLYSHMKSCHTIVFNSSKKIS